MNARQLRVILATVTFATLVLAIAVHDGEGPDFADLVDNCLHHEKLEAWAAIAWFLIFILLTWPKNARTLDTWLGESR